MMNIEQEEIRILTMYQPWCSLVADNFKLHETRPQGINWDSYRGIVALHAGRKNEAKSPLQTISLLQDGQGIPKELLDFALNAYELPTRSILVLCRFDRSLMMIDPRDHDDRWLETNQGRWIDINSVPRVERCVGNWQPGRKAILLKDVLKLPEPIPYADGKQGLTRAPEPIAAQLRAIWQRHHK